MIEKLLAHSDSGSLGWRKLKYWRKQLRNKERHLTQTLGKGGKNRAYRVKRATASYLRTARELSKKISDSEGSFADIPPSITVSALIVSLDHYQQFLDKHIDLVDRRLLQKETIPHEDKVFSIFESHTEWINKGKKHKRVELGHPVLIASDQYQFLLHHEVMVGQHDVEMAVPLARDICHTYKQDQLGSISFDRGFYSLPNYQNLQQYAAQVILPKKGNKTPEEAEREADKTFTKLRHKHSAVEANINQLEHHGLNKCPDKGLEAFKRYTALGVLAYNLHRLGKILIEKEKAKQKKKIRKQALKKAA